MSSNFGTWSPNDLILPTVESDLDYKFFFVKDSGSIEGLNIIFNAGDWLVYIKENGTGNWYKTSGGAAVVNLSDSSNLPDPGFYTKVRLDNFANIIDAEYLNADDLPKHTHDIDTITGDWETKVKSYLVEMFQSHSDSSVQFKYDKETQTISAEVNIDNDTITKNEWGELVSASSNNGSGSTTASTLTGKIKLEQVEDLSDRLSAIDANIQKNFIVCNAGSGLKARYADEGTYLSVKFDGTSLVLNSDGELSVAPNLITGGGAVDGSDISCGAHTHTTSQITDFEKAVLELIENNVTVGVTDIPIDGETIIINSKGQLACVAAGTRAHTHKMADITDLDPNKADVWASQQGLQSDVDYTNGKFDFTSQTIGYAVKTINEYLKDIDIRVSTIETKMSSIEVPEPNGIEFANFTVRYTGGIEVTDKDTFKTVLAGEGATFESDYFYPANKGRLDIFIDGAQVFSKELSDEIKLYASPTFKILGVRDSYYDNAMYRGTYDSMKIEFKVESYEEGYHAIKFVHTFNGETHTSKEFTFQTYQESTPTINESNVVIPSNNTYVSGVPCYNGDGKIQFSSIVKNAFTSQFINSTVYQYSLDNENWISPVISLIANGYVYYEPITVYVEDGSSGSVTVFEKAYNVLKNEFTKTLKTPSLLWNKTDVEKYRVIHGRDFDSQSPSVIGGQVLSEYNPENEVPMYEMVINNNIGSLVKTDYSNLNGPDYSNRNSDQNGFVWCNFRFDAPFMNNLHVDIKHKDGTPFELNKNGTLEGIKLYVTQSSTDSSAIWVDGNTPYPGYGKAEVASSKGLDLFKSDNVTRYITFGQRPDIDSGYLYIKVGVNSNIDLGALVSSVKESINEWS